MNEYEGQAALADSAQARMQLSIQNNLAGLRQGMTEVIDPSKDAAVKKAQTAQRDTSYMILAVALAAVIIGVTFGLAHITQRIKALEPGDPGLEPGGPAGGRGLRPA